MSMFEVVVQAVGMAGSTVRLKVKSGKREAVMDIVDGFLVDVRVDGRELGAEEALREVLSWKDAQISFEELDTKTVDPRMKVRVEEALLDFHAHLDEEAVRDAERLTGVDLKGGLAMPKEKVYEKILDELSGLAGFEGAAIVSDDGLIIASRFVKKYAQDKVAALIAETLRGAKKVTTEAGWGEPDNMVIEGDSGKLVLYKTRFGFVAVFGNKELNLGLARVTLDEAAEDLDKTS